MKNIYILCFIILMGCKSTETYTDSIERILIKPEQGMEILFISIGRYIDICFFRDHT